MPDIRIEFCKSLPDRKEFDALLSQYYALLAARMQDIGFPFDPATGPTAVAEFWANADAYLPPRGCLMLARDADGRLMGCGMLKRLDATTGEMKRDFVIEAARGTGTGRALIAARIAAARRMGLTRLVADTLRPNVEMRTLYPKLGFVELDTPIATTTHAAEPALHPYMHYFAMDL